MPTIRTANRRARRAEARRIQEKQRAAMDRNVTSFLFDWQKPFIDMADVFEGDRVWLWPRRAGKTLVRDAHRELLDRAPIAGKLGDPVFIVDELSGREPSTARLSRFDYAPVILGVDYATVETRILADMAHSRPTVTVVETDHTEKMKEETDLKEYVERMNKAIDWRIMYGMGAATFRDRLVGGTTLKHAKKIDPLALPSPVTGTEIKDT